MKRNKPSATARIIARSMVIQNDSADLYRMFCNEFSGGRDYLLSIAESGWFRSAVFFLESKIIPGIFRHYLMRKKFIEKTIQKLLEEDYRQIVFLGAGFDALPLKLAALKRPLKIMELDYPSTQQVKTRALRRRNSPDPVPEYIPCDLQNTPLPVILEGTGFRKDLKTVFVAEGLFMYIDQEDLERLISDTGQVCDAGCILIFTFLECYRNNVPDFRIHSRSVNFWLALKGEKFRWGISRSAMAVFLDKCGYRLLNITDPDNEAGDPAEITPGELICTAQKVF